MSKKLTHDFLSMRTKNSRLDQIKTLNLWGNDLRKKMKIIIIKL